MGIIVAGCSSFDREVDKSCETFNLSTNTWTPIASLNEARLNAAAAAVDNVVYVFGGMPARDDVEQYDDTADTWTLLTTTMHVGRYRLAVACVNSSVYLLGGWNYFDAPLESRDCLKPDKRRYLPKAKLPVACYFLSAVSHDVSDEALLKVLLRLL
jgi:hypothetical protein